MKPFSVTVPDLTAALVALVRQVPKGRVTTYGDLAAALGDRGATRWVAGVLSEPPESLWEVAHRVVKATGEPGRFPPDGFARLAGEGVRIEGGRADLGARFRAFEGDPPLQRLKEEQEAIASQVRLTKLHSIPKTVAGVD